MGKLNEQVQLPIGMDQALRKPLYDFLQAVARKVNAMADGRLSAYDDVRTSVPTSGTWKQGDFVRKSNPVVAGGGGSQYVIIGWTRITDGSANVLNTDWVENRTLTGT